jgi:hypothetical protein
MNVFGEILQRLQTIRHCERSEAIQRDAAEWIASSLSLLAMTETARMISEDARAKKKARAKRALIR